MPSFLDDLAAGTPAPGGGYAAAITGAMGAALVSMVCKLTLAKAKFKPVETQIQAILAKSEVSRARLEQLANHDEMAVNNLMAALALPKTTVEQQTQQRQAVQAGYKQAAESSLAIAGACATVMELGQLAAELGSPTAWGDAQAAIFCGKAGVSASALNGYLNLAFIRDDVFVAASQLALANVLANCNLTGEVYSLVQAH